AVETMTVAVVGSAVGWAAGVGLAGLLKGMFDAFGFALPAGGLVIKPSSTAIALLAGLVATAVAGVVPSIRASRVAPLAALRDLAVEAPIVAHGRAVIGIGITAAGVVAAVAAVSGAGTGLAALGAAATVAGAVILGPVLVRPVVGTLGRPVAAGRGITGALSRQNAIRKPR